MELPKFVPRPKFEEYREQFKDYFYMERRNGIILVRMHTNGGPVVWTHQQHNAMGQVWHVIGNDPENEVMILTSTGQYWIAKGDQAIDEATQQEVMKGDPTKPIYEFYTYDSTKLVSNLINDVDIPTIAAINGPGIHTEMGLLCDITLCSEDTLFNDMHFLMGWVPGDGQYLAFQKLLGDKRATYYIYTGKTIDAKSALEWGMVSEVLPREKLLDRAWEIAESIMKQPRVNRRVTCQLVRRPWKRLLTDDFDLHIANEFFSLAVTKPKHDFDKITKPLQK